MISCPLAMDQNQNMRWCRQVQQLNSAMKKNKQKKKLMITETEQRLKTEKTAVFSGTQHGAGPPD